MATRRDYTLPRGAFRAIGNVQLVSFAAAAAVAAAAAAAAAAATTVLLSYSASQMRSPL